MLLLDEPLGALDLKLRKEMQLELKSMQPQLGITFIYVKMCIRDRGMGEAPAAAVDRKAVERGDRRIVESETCQPSGREEARSCMDFLKAQE